MNKRDLLAKAAEFFNRRMYFECHDLLEEAWTGEKGEEKRFLKGLIHVAVGMYHLSTENHRGAFNQLEKGVEVLDAFAPERHGLNLDTLTEKARVCRGKAKRSLEGESVAWSRDDLPEMELSRG